MSGGVSWREADEHEALPGLHPHRDQAEVLHLEVLEVVGVLGPDEVPLQVVDPGVIRTLEPDRGAALLFDDGGAAVTTHVVEGPQLAVATASDQEWLVVDRGQEIRAGGGCVLLAPDDHPVAPEPFPLLEVVDPGVVIRASGKQRRSPVRLADGCDLLRGQRTRGHDFGTSFLGSRNGMAAVRADQRPPSGASTSRGVPGSARPIGTHT